jgi:hypothetical protein
MENPLVNTLQDGTNEIGNGIMKARRTYVAWQVHYEREIPSIFCS